MSALRFAPLRCGVPHVRLAQRVSRALTLGLLRGHSDLEGLPGRLIHFIVGVRRGGPRSSWLEATPTGIWEGDLWMA